MPTFNAANHIVDALDSLVGQDYANLQLVISDNASTDGTADICREYAQRDSRIIVHTNNRNRGSVWNLNHVFRLTDGPLFMWAASDDRWHSTFVSRCFEALRANTRAVIAHPYQQYMTYEGEPLGEPFVGFENLGVTLRQRWRNALNCWPLHMAYYGLMWREVAARTRLTLLRDSSDFIFISEMSLQGEIVQVPEVLFWKRLGPTGTEVRRIEDLWGLIAAGSASPTSSALVRLDVMRECLRGAKRSVPRSVYRRLRLDTLAAYLSPRNGYLSMDVKELARRILGERFYRVYKARRIGPGKSGK